MAKSGTQLGLVDLSSGIPTGRGIWWPRTVLCQVSLIFGQPLGQADLWSDEPPMIQASSGQEWYYIRSA